LYLAQFLLGKLTFYGRLLKPIACVALVRKAVALVRKAVDGIRNTIFLISFGVNKKLDCSN
jgi:hypothetical protein